MNFRLSQESYPQFWTRQKTGYLASFFIKRDFLRAAVFFLITPLLFALSITCWSFGINLLASSFFLAKISFLYSLITPCISFLRFKLKTFFLLEDLRAFLAESVIGIILVFSSQYPVSRKLAQIQ